jgi:hypothetical protein
MVTAKKCFSDASSNREWNAMLLKSSGNNLKVAQARKEVYRKVFSRYDEMKDSMKTFSGAAESPILSNQYFNATMASYVRSFAGFTCIERDMDQPTALLWYFDLMGVLDGRDVLPNVGPEDLDGLGAKLHYSGDASSLSAEQQFSFGEKIIPGSVVVKLIHAADPTNAIIAHDDMKGNLVAAANVLTTGTVDYINGILTIQLGTGFVPATGDSYYIAGTQDTPGTPEFGQAIPSNGYVNRFKLQQYNIPVTSTPDLLIAENNLLTIAAAQRAMGVNTQDVADAKITELYTKLINKLIVDALVRADNSTEYEINSAQWVSDFYDYQSRLDAFKAELINVDSLLAKKSVKGVMATAYVVSTELGNWFRKLTSDNLFVDNTDSTYINDLIGYYKGVPVLRHDTLDAMATDGKYHGYAIHKTSDGQLAPAIRGIFLPLTATPTVGNYNNPTQTASGVFYQEATSEIIPELIQKFCVNSL